MTYCLKQTTLERVILVQPDLCFGCLQFRPKFLRSFLHQTRYGDEQNKPLKLTILSIGDIYG